MAQLGTKAVGSVVTIPINGAATEMIIVHQGNPDVGLYDSSCDGTWLVTKQVYGGQIAAGTSDYKNSALHTYLSDTFFALLDASVQATIKQVKIPYWNGVNYGGTLASGANGLSCKIFALSAREMGCTNSYIVTDGSKLDYFSSNNNRIAYSGSTAVEYSTRTAYVASSSTYDVYHIDISTTGNGVASNVSAAVYVRPACIMPSTVEVNEDGSLVFNAMPVISDVQSAAGTTQSAPFTHKYKVTDADGDALTVTEYLDGVAVSTRSGIASGTTLTFARPSTEEGFRTIRNGAHTLKASASDGTVTTEREWLFTKAVYSAGITLSEPLAVAGDIEVAILTVGGNIPADAVLKVEATNNALDASPVWQDCTAAVKAGENIVFNNKTAARGAAFNFRLSISRGASGEGGYISSVSGAFQ